MKMGRIIFLAALACLLLTGCAQQATVVRGPNFEQFADATYMILPFGDANEASDRLRYPNAASMVRDAFETAFMEQGFKLKSCPEARTSGAIRGVTQNLEASLTTETPSDSVKKQQLTAQSEVRLGDRGVTEEHAIEAGKQANADVVLVGVVTAFYRGIYLHNNKAYTTVGFSVKAIDVKTGQIVWKASRMQKTGWQFNYDPGMYAQEIARNLAKQLCMPPEKG